MAICFYITAHGYGHAVRELAIINQIPPEIPIILRSMIPAEFVQQELRRPALHAPAAFDCGAVQFDSVNVDAKATLERYASLHAENHRRVDAEMEFLRQHAVRLVVTDVASFPCFVSQQAKIPSVVISNFTWADIYAEHVDRFPEYAPLLKSLRSEYRQATAGLILPFALPMADVPNHRQVGLVCRASRDIRTELAAYHQISTDKRWVLVYIGQGESQFQWERLASATDTVFLVLGREAPQLPNILNANPMRFGGQNIIATCDLVVAKPGYGIVADCVASGTPLLYTSRQDFAEYVALHRDLALWGAGQFVPPEIFYQGDLEPEIAWAASLTGQWSGRLDGTTEVAAILTEMWDESRAVG